MSLKEEGRNILQKLLKKLQDLPQGSYLDLAGFCVIMLFWGMVLFIIGLSCSHCCIGGKSKYHPSKVQPLLPR